MTMKVELLDELLKDCKTQEDIFGDKGIFKQLVKAITERALQSELTTHLGYEKHDIKGNNSGNSRNGTSMKVVKGEFGQTELAIPRDRVGTFEPQLIQKGQSRFDGFDNKILSMYARGLSTRDIQAQLQELYGVEVSATLISNVTDAVLDEVKTWQSRPLDRVYPIIYFDALVVKVRVDKQVINKAIHLALGINMDGEKELLGMWCNTTEGAKFWLSVLTELRNRGVQDVLICCCDGLTGFPAAIEALNMTLLKVIKNKRMFPSDDAAFKQIYLALQNISKKSTIPIRDCKPALARFMIEFEGRV